MDNKDEKDINIKRTDQEEFDKQILEQEAIEASWKTPSFQYKPKEIVPPKTFEFEMPEKRKYKTLKPDETLHNIVTPDGKSIATDGYIYNKDDEGKSGQDRKSKEYIYNKDNKGKSSQEGKSKEYVYNKDFVRKNNPDTQAQEPCEDDHVFDGTTKNKRVYTNEEINRINYMANQNTQRKDSNKKPTFSIAKGISFIVIIYVIIRIISFFIRF